MLSHVQLFFRQEYPFPTLRDLPDPRIKPPFLLSPTLTVDYYTTRTHLGSPTFQKPEGIKETLSLFLCL